MRHRFRKRALTGCSLCSRSNAKHSCGSAGISIGVSLLFSSNRICVDCLSPQPFFATRSMGKRKENQFRFCEERDEKKKTLAFSNLFTYNSVSTLPRGVTVAQLTLDQFV